MFVKEAKVKIISQFTEKDFIYVLETFDDLVKSHFISLVGTRRMMEKYLKKVLPTTDVKTFYFISQFYRVSGERTGLAWRVPNNSK